MVREMIERSVNLQPFSRDPDRSRRGRGGRLGRALLALALLPLGSVFAAAEATTAEAGGDTAPPMTEPAVAAAAAAVPATALERARSTARLRLGYIDGMRPFSYKDATGNPAGYAVALCERVADAVKAELAMPSLAIEWVEQSSDTRISDVQEGRVDVECAAGVESLAARAHLSFSIPVFPGSVGALLRRDASSRLQELLEEGPPHFRPFWRAAPTQLLGEQTLAAVPGGSADAFLAERAATLRLTSEIVHVDDFADGLRKVLSREVDVFFADRALLLDAARNHPAEGDLVVLDRKFTLQPIALGIARGDEDLRLLVDRTLSRLHRSGELLKIYEASFGEPDESTLAYFRMSALPE